MTFPYFVMKKAPVSGVESLMDYQATIFGEHRDGKTEVWLKVVVPTTSLCPCSKQISDYGAHNQRSHITIDRQAQRAHVDRGTDRHRRARSLVRGLWDFEAAGREIRHRAGLRQPQVRRGYGARRGGALNKDKRVRAYVVESENFESIHNHSAYAMIEHDKETGR